MPPPYIPKLMFVQRSLINLVLLTLMTVGVSSAGAEELTLTGIVKQPTPPHSPAPDSTVTVYEKGIEIEKDTTDRGGSYTFKVARGKNVVVRASWRSGKSTPGYTEVKVVANPTRADVQLLPPKGASADAWLDAGKLIAKTSGESVMLVPETLQQAQVPAASIFQFVRGARTESSESFKGLVKVTMFNPKDWPVVAQGLQKAEQQYKSTGTVPNYLELAAKLKGWLTVQQHAEIIGFIAPRRDEDASKKWEAAVEQSVGPELTTEIIAKKEILDAHLFAVR
jgi:hypothetical protein